MGFLARLKIQSVVALAVETSIQNKLIALANLALLFNGLERDISYAVPIIYALFGVGFNFCIMVIAWKLGWTYLDKDKNFREVYKDYKQHLKELKLKAEQEYNNEDPIDGDSKKVSSPTSSTSSTTTAIDSPKF